uniref:Non-structural maintenance of chromosomes element 1 homolog n=1 Tax=Heliothis virescens TaxID=7102 RepID=A0A2A4JL89_HELVI
MTYGKLHRFFLRTVASQGVLSFADAETALNNFNNDEDSPPVQDVVKAINDQIRPYQQEIKITKDEFTNEDVIIFLSLGYDDATKSQNLFSASELEYFRVLIEQIMTTESRQITGINAINLVGRMKSTFTKTDAQKLLNTWCRMRYLDKEQNNYALGVRAIHEFEGYLRQNMPDAIEECFLCKSIVFRGYNCPACSKAVHTRCLIRYLEKVDKWPCCKLDFSQEQLERLNNEGSRLTQTQVSDTSRNSAESSLEEEVTHQGEENNTVAEPTQVQESSETMDISQDVIPEISQRVTRKRKRQQ